MPASWRNRQKTLFVAEDIEFEQDQRIIDWLDSSKKTYISGDNYFDNKVTRTSDTKQAEQALLIFRQFTNIKTVEIFCKQVVHVPKVCVTINKFLIYTNKFNEDIDENYDIALLKFMQSIFLNRKIDHYYIENDNGSYFNFASPATQFFIT